MRQHQSGMALIVQVLFTAVLLMAIIAATTQLALGTRRSSANDVAAYQAVLASESAQNAFVPRSITVANFNAPARCKLTKTECVTFYTTAMETWLQKANAAAQKVGSVALANGSATLSLVSNSVTVALVDGTGPGTLKPAEWTMTGVDIESTSTAANSGARVLQRYAAVKKDLPPLDIGAAVISHPSVVLKGASEVHGQGLGQAGNDGIYQDLFKVKAMDNGATSLTLGSPIDVQVTSGQNRVNQAPVGSYLRLPLLGSLGNALNAYGTFKVTQNFGSSLQLTPINLPTGVTANLGAQAASADFVYNAITAISGNNLTVRNTQTFVKGDTIAFTQNGITYKGTVSTAPVDGFEESTKNITVSSWTPPLPGTVTTASMQGSPVTKSTLGVITAGTFDPGKTAPIGGYLDAANAPATVSQMAPDPLNDKLFIKTFGMTPSELKAKANVITEPQFGAAGGIVNGLMWMTQNSNGSTNLNSEKPTGSGILIIEGDFTLNQNSATECALSGLIYVRGNLNIQGNLQMCGSIVVEGSILDTAGNVVSWENDPSQFAGNGRKVTYDPDALFDAVSGAGEYDFTANTGTWRQR
jgi:Tfp pilus assembly protein PilX